MDPATIAGIIQGVQSLFTNMFGYFSVSRQAKTQEEAIRASTKINQSDNVASVLKTRLMQTPIILVLIVVVIFGFIYVQNKKK